MANLTVNTKKYGQITLNTKPHSDPPLIVRDREFQSLKQVLEGKARLFKQQGKANSLTNEP